MSANLRVDCTAAGEGWLCRVDVSDGTTLSTHDVTISAAELERLAMGHSEPNALVEESFRFLLEREPRESVLRRFAISEIERYFPEYPGEIRERLAR